MGQGMPLGCSELAPAITPSTERTAVDLKTLGGLVPHEVRKDTVDLTREWPNGIFVDSDPAHHESRIVRVGDIPRLV